MIISASYKTDIPAFYGEWFIHRLRAGWCRMVNPYGRQVYTVDLRPEAVDGFVFWTKNVGPFMDALGEVHERGYPFILQLGINGYPRELEHSVVNPARSIEHAREIAERYGRRVVVWRYDTIILSSLTGCDFHRENFRRLADSLEGVTDEVVISFAQIYRKTLRNMNQAAKEQGFTWEDPGAERKRGFVSDLTAIARAHGMKLSICSQRDLLVDGAEDARCIDAGRLSDVAGRLVSARLKGNRKECGCHQCRDIGEYDTCPHGCIYCYAVNSPGLAQSRFKAHDPHGEFLFPPAEIPANNSEECHQQL